MIIYKITNLINGKIYIGQTVQTFKQRKAEYKSAAKKAKTNRPIINAIRKYGLENFHFEIIDNTATDFFELDLLEIRYIKELNSMVPVGYNIEAGGQYYMHGITHQNFKFGLNKFYYVGVKHARDNLYYSIISKMGETYKMGYFEGIENAAIAYDLKALSIYGKDCQLNFPENREKYLNKDIGLPKIIETRKKSSQYRYVHKLKSGKFKAILQFKDSSLSIGTYLTELEASIAVDLAIFNKRILDKEFNFPENILKYRNNEILMPVAVETQKQYHGLYQNKRNKKYYAWIGRGKDRVSLGGFELELDAVHARDLALIEQLGPDTDINIEENRAKYLSGEIVSKARVTSSKYRGVRKVSDDKYHVSFNGKFIRSLSDEILAARLYDLTVIEQGGNLKFLNFPNDLEKYKNSEIKIPEKPPLKKKSKYPGINKCHNGWSAIYGKIRLGLYETEDQAVIARDLSVIKLNGDLKLLGKPENLEQYKNGDISFPPNVIIKNSSKFNYVSLKKERGYWVARKPQLTGKSTFLASFDTEIEAAKAVNEYLIKNNIRLDMLNPI